MLQQTVPMFFLQFPGNFQDVLTLVEIIRKINLLPAQFLVAQLNRVSQYPHLPSGIVEIILPDDLVIAPFQKISNGIANHRLASMTDG